MKKWLSGAAVLLLTGLGLGIGVVTAAPALAVAPGCSSAAPTRITGSLVSYPHGYTVNAAIGISYATSGRQNVAATGRAPSAGGYAATWWINQSLPASGDPTDHGTRTWGSVCVAGNITFASLEVMPSVKVGTVTRQTVHTYYGGAADEFDPIRPGQVNTIALRVPEDVTTSYPATMSNVTGYANGYITCNSARCGSHRTKPIPQADLVIRAFPWDGGAACGIQGFAAGPDVFGPSSSPTGGEFYRINGLAGGQCGSSAQEYSFRVTCNSWCGGAPQTRTVDTEITAGAGKGVFFNF